MRRRRAGGSRTVLAAVVVALVLAGAGTRAIAQEALAVLVAPGEPVTAGQTVSVWLLVVNPTAAPATFDFPPALTGTLHTGAAEQPAGLVLARSGEAMRVDIPPGGHARREYRLALPEPLEGQAVVSVETPQRLRAALEVRRPVAATPAPPLLDVTGAASEFDPVAFFKEHLFGHEPFYFLAGTAPPNAKFQISFKYQVVSNRGSLAQRVPALKGLFLGYSQTSLWDWSAPSAPFDDSSYRPELFYQLRQVDRGRWAPWLRLDLQTGLQHESNGRAGSESRSLNVGYLEPTVVFGRPGGFQVSLAPRALAYFGDLSDNPDVKQYRGYVSLRSVVGWQRGLQLAATGRLGDHGNRGSVQADLTFPMAQFLFGSFSLYFHLQGFYGYGETLQHYNELGSSIRAGIALYR